MIFNTRVVTIVIVSLLIIYLSLDLFSRSGGSGISGLTATNSAGCSCHYSSANSNTSLSVTSSTNSFKFKPGDQVNFTVSVSNSNRAEAGLNVAVKSSETGSTNSGSLSFESGSGLRSENSEITHSTPKAISSGKADFTFTWTAPTTPGTYYLRAIGNAVDNDNSADGDDQYNWLTPKQLIVVGLDIVAPTQTSNWCVNTSQAIKWTSNGIDQVKIELSSDGGANYSTVIANSLSAGSGTYDWTIPSSLTSGNNYKIRISDASDNTIKIESSTFSISSTTSITTHPQSLEVCEGTPVTLSVAISGNATSYYWKKNNVQLSNSNAASYVITNPNLSDSGTYVCVINPPCGSPIESNPAVLKINETVGITQNPQSKELCLNQPIQLIAKTKGKNKIVKWFKDNTELANLNKDTLTINVANESDAGSYYLKVSADCGNQLQSLPAVVKVNSPIQITDNLTNKTYCEGDTLKLSIKLSAGKLANIIWQKDGQNINNENSTQLIIPNLSNANAGNYKAIITDECSNQPLISNEALVLVNLKPTITEQAKSIEAFEGENITLSIKANNANSYQWRKNGNNIDKATEASFSIKSALISDSGDYDCVVSNNCGNITSNKATVKVNENASGPLIQMDANELNFGNVEIGNKQTKTIIIKNAGDKVLEITSLELSKNEKGNFSDLNQYPISINPAESKVLSFDFSPKELGNIESDLSIKSNSNNSPTIKLFGFSQKTEIILDISEIDFGNVDQGANNERSFKIKNGSNVDAKIISASFEDNIGYKLSENLDNKVLKSNEELNIKVQFESTNPGEFKTKLLLDIDLLKEKIAVNLSAKVISTSVDDLDNVFEIYPNPTNETLKISNNQQIINSIKIIDNLGNIHFNSAPNSNELNININELNTGNYFLIINFEGKVVVKKFVKM